MVVAGAYPLAEAVRAVVADDLPVRDLTPSGAEPHDLEISPRDTDRILAADLVVYVGGGFQPAVSRAASRVPASLDVRALPGNGGPDPHVWLDPTKMQAIVQRVASLLATQVPARARGFERRAQQFVDDLGRLDRRWKAGLVNCDRRTLVTAHAAFGHLANRYALTQEAIAGTSPETEPSSTRIDEVIAVVKSTGTTTIFTEDLVSPAVARTVARETKTKTALLDPIESARPKGDRGYIARMDANLGVVRAALGCR